LETIDRVWKDNLGESASRKRLVEIRPVENGQYTLKNVEEKSPE